MFAQIENSKGIISYDNSLMDEIVNEALKPFKNNYKFIKKNYEIEEEGLVIDLVFQLKFGTSIKDFTDNIFDVMSNRIENNLELTIKSITVWITGIYSKKLSKRNIVISYGNKSGITDNRD